MWLCVCVCVCVCVTVCVWLCVAVCLQVYGELAVRLVAAGDVPAAEQALIGYGSTPVVSALFAPAHTACRLCAGRCSGGKVVATFRGVVGYEQAHASLERYWPAVHPSAS